MKKVDLTDKQRERIEKLWFIYGNHGEKSTMPDHHFIQDILENGEDWRDIYKPSAECILAVDKVLLNVPLRYWYKFYIEECVLCGHTSKYKVRQYTEKPENPEDRYVYTQTACGDHFVYESW